MTQAINIRGTTYEIAIVTDIQVTILTQAIQAGMTDALAQAQIAYTINSACPDMPNELISHKIVRMSDGSSEEIFAQNLDADEVVAFASVFVIAMLEMRVERLKGMSVEKEKESQVQDAIAKFTDTINETKNSTRNIQLEVLLSSVGAFKKQPTKATSEQQNTSKFKGFAPIAAGVKDAVAEADKLSKLKTQMAELEAEMSRVQTVDIKAS